MLTLTIRTDKPESEIGLYQDDKRVVYMSWEAHRQLAETIHTKLDELLAKAKFKLEDLQGITVYQGPGSFTGLRIGCSVANALGDSFHIPIVGADGEKWIERGIKDLLSGKNSIAVTPNYGSEALTTKPRK